MVIFMLFIIAYLLYDGNATRESLLKRLKKLENGQKGNKSMSQIIKNLVGKNCKIKFEGIFGIDAVYTILEVDEDWVCLLVENKQRTKDDQRCPCGNHPRNRTAGLGFIN